VVHSEVKGALATVTIEIESSNDKSVRTRSNSRQTRQTPNSKKKVPINMLTTVKEDTQTDELGNTGTCHHFQ